MTTVKTLAKNTTVLFIANIISYLLGFFTTLYAARYLGVEGFGVLSLALAFTGIFNVFTDLGLSTLTIREVSRNKSLANKYIGNTTVMKIFFAVLTLTLTFFTVKVLGYPQSTSTVIYLITFSIIFGAFSGVFTSIFQAFEKMEYMSITIILNAVLMLAGVLTVIYYHLGVIAMASVYLVVSVIILISNLAIYSLKFFIPKIKIDWKFWKPTLKESLSFGLSNILIVIYFYIDSVMLSVMVGNSAVGIYNAAYKLIFVTLFIPGVFVISIFPIMSQHFESSKDSLKLEYEKSFKYLFALGIFIFMYGFIFADKIISIIYGNGYTAAIFALQVLIFVVPIIFITNLFGNILGAVNRQRIMLIVTSANALFNIVLNLILIPEFSYIGSSVATVLTEGLGFILMFCYISKYFFKISVTQNILKTVFVGIVVTLIMYCLKVNVNWVLAVILGLIMYLVSLYLTKVITEEDMNILKEIF
ncbi:flippase [Methanobacterium aggregans]|uniref:flippase n=1 Tax=Methanobacterium aggregans TaxID=1615586 RepID=UPI001AE4B38E|nr:flippase [Methanobacterium aggregans]MBP2045061.1 O-antigen/teichoic acid export membrane protein [Methanobacterium aggregans]